MHTRATYVRPDGDPTTAKVAIVGEQPGKMEVIKGKAFVGPSGMELDNDLHSAKLARRDCYITNVIKDIDRVLGHYIEQTKKGFIVKPEGQKYIDTLATELNNCSAKVILALGNIALFALTDREGGIYKWRGSVLKSTLVPNKLVVPSIHPATIIPPKNMYLNKRLLIWDIKKARKIALEGWSPKKRDITIRPTFTKCIQFLKTCELYGLLGNIIDYDIEIVNEEMSCISFAYSPTDVISIPFIYEKGDYFIIPQELEVMQLIASILENSQIQKRGQNLCFDVHFLLRKYGIQATNLHDTMIAQKILMPDYKVGLDFICSIYTDLPYYKDDGKYWLKGIGTFDSGWQYNALDSVVCAEAGPKQLEDLQKQGNWYTYERKRRIILPLVYMMERGIKINLGTMKDAYNEGVQEVEKLTKKLHESVGYALNPNSPKQIAEHFYKKLGIKPYRNRKTGGVSTDEKALKRIGRRGYKDAYTILKIRGTGKETSTFLSPTKVDRDSRMRCSFNPVGTRFSRISSSKNIFGTGNNLQNQPHKVLQHFTPDSHYVAYGLDLSQAENRIVAYEGRIDQMIEAFETGQDVHSLTAKIMITIFYGPEKGQFITPEDLSPLGDGTKTWRDWGKRANHGLNYDLGYKAFALGNEITERDGKLIVNTYHLGYPGVRQGYHTYVQRCINTSRTLTNLMGRKTIFLDRLDDKLYKAAYACIPQGTVGDVIDTRAMNYIYYNKHKHFRLVELLMQIHDQIVFQIPTPLHPTKAVSWADHARVLLDVRRSMETPLHTHYGRKFTIPSDLTMGITLNKDSGVEMKGEGFPRDIPTLAQKLEKSYYELTKIWLPMVA